MLNTPSNVQMDYKADRFLGLLHSVKCSIFYSTLAKPSIFRIRKILIMIGCEDFFFRAKQKWGLMGSSHIGRALELLSYGHNLSAITIRLEDFEIFTAEWYNKRNARSYDEGSVRPDEDNNDEEDDSKRAWKLFNALFIDPPKTILEQQILKVQGIDRLSIKYFNPRVKWNLENKVIERWEKIMYSKIKNSQFISEARGC